MPADTAFDILVRGMRDRPAHPAVRMGTRQWTYAEIDALARRYAAGLKSMNLRPGDRVAVLAGASVEHIAVLLGHYHAGLIHVPVNTRYRAAEVAHILADAGAAAVVVDAPGMAVLDEPGADHPVLTELPRVVLGTDAPLGRGRYRFSALVAEAPAPPGCPGDDDLALLIYTSGTTGKSKGAALTMGAVVRSMYNLTSLWQWCNADVLVLALPLFHIHGLGIGVHGALMHGATIDLLPRFVAADVVDAVRRGGTVFMGVPTMYRMLLEHLDEHPGAAAVLATARLFTAGSAALAAADWNRFAEHTGHRILERYGMSETMITLSNPYHGDRRPGAVGLPVPGFTVRVVDDTGAECAADTIGEIAVRGIGVMTGYWNQPAATEATMRDGWFMTGDMATRDPDGYVHIVGRRSVDIIKSGGFKISAREIEEVIAQHPAVAEVAVVGAPDAKWGQRIVAVIVPSSAEHRPDPSLVAELGRHTSAHLADYKKPRAVAIVNQLPRNAMGKIQKPELVRAMTAGAITVFE